MWNALNSKESMLILKSRQLWLRDGDKNSHFFHKSMKERYIRNAISVLEGVNGKVERVDEIKIEIKNHIVSFFKEKFSNRPTPEGIPINSLYAKDRLFLESKFTEEEVREAIWSSDGDKSAGPDGYSLYFFKHNWDVVKVDIFRSLEDFHVRGKLMKACTSSFIMFVPKCKNPQSLSEFRLICLCGKFV